MQTITGELIQQAKNLVERKDRREDHFDSFDCDLAGFETRLNDVVIEMRNDPIQFARFLACHN